MQAERKQAEGGGGSEADRKRRRARREEPPVSGAMNSKGFRLDIQGVRGIALVIILLTHAEVPFFDGGFVGLDMFFVLSGFLITGLIVTEIERTGFLSFAGFYGRRAKRILPHAVLALLGIAAGSMLLFSVIRRDQVSGDVIAAALYFVNWRFAFEQVDYFNFAASDVSPVQHYWSLSVEEQFYLGWPLLLVLATVWAARSGRPLRPTLFLFVLPVAVLSLAYSIWFTPTDTLEAYFSTLTRIWQLAIGGLLALALPLGLRWLRPQVSGLLVVLGLAAIAYGTVAFNAETPYPGWRGLLPCVATVVLIFAGTAVTVSGPVRMLTTAPLQYLGKISYAWYLWHWPAIVFAREIWGSDLSPLALLAITGVAWLPAAFFHYTVEEPFRRSKPLARRPRRALAVGLACTFAATIAGVGLQLSQPTIRTASEGAARGAEGAPGVIQRSAEAVRPDPREVQDDRGQLFEDDCKSKTGPGDCVYGVPGSSTTVVLMGDSHAVQYFPTLDELAKRRGWRLVALARADCTVADVEYQSGCDEWREDALSRIEAEQPELTIFTNGTTGNYRVVIDGERLDRDASQPYLEAGFARTLRRARATGAEVAVIRDQPRAPTKPAECVAESLQDLERCAFPADRPEEWAYPAHGARKVQGVHLVDPMPVLCPDGDRCPAVIGNVVVYRDEYHLSATFARSMWRWMGRKLPELAPPEPTATSTPS